MTEEQLIFRLKHGGTLQYFHSEKEFRMNGSKVPTILIRSLREKGLVEKEINQNNKVLLTPKGMKEQ